jgi:hypothetical protein
MNIALRSECAKTHRVTAQLPMKKFRPVKTHVVLSIENNIMVAQLLPIIRIFINPMKTPAYQS